MFSPSPKARASFRTGTVYAIDGGDTYIYYGQIAADESIGFFKHRSKALSSIEEVLAFPFMSRFYVYAITDALREGKWHKLGIAPLHDELKESPYTVQWSVSTQEMEVSIWKGNQVIKNTVIHDPQIQNLEIMGVFSAVYHVPKRLGADFIGGFSTWPVGGPIWRERVKKEEMARNHPEQPWHTLPKDWVPVSRSACDNS